MRKLIHRRQALFTLGSAAILAAPALIALPSPAGAATSYADFSGAWLVDPRRRPAGGRGPDGRRPDGPPPEGQRRPPPFARRDGFGPGGPGGPGGPRGEDVKIDGVGVPGLDRGDRHVYQLMTAEGRAAFAAMDPLDLPANNCKSPGLPSIVGTPNLQVWSATGDTLTIHHEYYDTWRTIHLDRRSHPEPAAHTPLGDAVSWIDGDSLVIETTNLAATPGGLARNAPASDARTVVERYRLSPDKDTLYGEMTLSDPKFLTQSITVPVAMRRQPAGTDIEIFPCSIDAARSYLETK